MRATARPFVSFPQLLTFVSFLFLYLLFVRYCAYVSYSDPTSIFFDPVQGHQRHYSIQRQNEAESYIQSLSVSASLGHGSRPPRMCIGIPTVARDGPEQYVRSTVGSLLVGLNAAERNEIYLTVLIAHTLPHIHPISHEQWFESAVDNVLYYNMSQQQQTNIITSWEKDKAFAKKGLYDYIYTLQHCTETGAQWVTMIEDDTLAAEGWYPRAIHALERADYYHQGGSYNDWLYLRLFFTEEFLGWNMEELPIYSLAAAGMMTIVAVCLLVIRRHVLSRYFTDSIVLSFTFIYTPALIALYFAAGRLTVLPLAPGVREMPRFGCCAQGLVFPREMAIRTVSYLKTRGEGFVDEFLEGWANEEGFVRWAVVPSLLQHIGQHSSKGDDFGINAKWGHSVAEKIWSFGFERLGGSQALG